VAPQVTILPPGRIARCVWGQVGAPIESTTTSAPCPQCDLTWPQTQRAIRPGGRMVTCGATGGPQVELDIRRLFWFQWSLLGSTMGTSAEFETVVQVGNQGLFRPLIDTTFPLDRAVEGYRRLAAGKQFGKIVLEVSP
jgi:NADPH:quinone reductase-like Zn-dependent oxidoreductase